MTLLHKELEQASDAIKDVLAAEANARRQSEFDLRSGPICASTLGEPRYARMTPAFSSSIAFARWHLWKCAYVPSMPCTCTDVLATSRYDLPLLCHTLCFVRVHWANGIHSLLRTLRIEGGYVASELLVSPTVVACSIAISLAI